MDDNKHNNTSNEVMYGVYSAMLEEILGSDVYESLDRPGEFVVVTGGFPSRERAYAAMLMDDEYCGKIGKFVRVAKKPRVEQIDIQLEQLRVHKQQK